MTKFNHGFVTDIINSKIIKYISQLIKLIHYMYFHIYFSANKPLNQEKKELGRFHKPIQFFSAKNFSPMNVVRKLIMVK